MREFLFQDNLEPERVYILWLGESVQDARISCPRKVRNVSHSQVVHRYLAFSLPLSVVSLPPLYLYILCLPVCVSFFLSPVPSHPVSLSCCLSLSLPACSWSVPKRGLPRWRTC